jgi:hypothetical protein
MLSMFGAGVSREKKREPPPPRRYPNGGGEGSINRGRVPGELAAFGFAHGSSYFAA